MCRPVCQYPAAARDRRRVAFLRPRPASGPLPQDAAARLGPTGRRATMRVAAPIGMGGYGPRILRAGLQALCLALAVATDGWGATRAAYALTPEVRTDANIITAVDISDSIGRHEEWLQQTGLVRALLD